MRMRGGRGSGNQEGEDEVVGRMQGGEVLKSEGGAGGGGGVKENGRKKRGVGWRWDKQDGKGMDGERWSTRMQLKTCELREGGREGGMLRVGDEDAEESQGEAQPCMLMSHHYMLL